MRERILGTTGMLLLPILLLCAVFASAEEPAETETSSAEPKISSQAVIAPAPEWADVQLNEHGFLDEGEYILEDEGNGHWMYVSQTLRIQIVKSREDFPRPSKKCTKDQSFNCFTAEIWCDIESGELPLCIWQDPELKEKTKKPKSVEELAQMNNLVYAVSADYYQSRATSKKSDKSCHVGIEIRNGEILWDDPSLRPPAMPTYETLALYWDGHAESYPSVEKGAEEYLADGAMHVYTFGPCLVKDGEITVKMINSTSIAYNPRHAFGVIEPGHYIDVICEGRMATMKGNHSTGVTMKTLAEIMLQRGCTLAVNLDGGETAVCAFMGKKLNWVVEPHNPGKLIAGRAQAEVMAFGMRPEE